MRPLNIFRIITIVLFSFISIVSFSQADFSSQLSLWKSKFPEEEFVAASYKTIISFTLNVNPKPGFAKVNVLVRNEITIVLTKDFKAFDDGLFYNQQVSIDNVKAVNPKGKELVKDGRYSKVENDKLIITGKKVYKKNFDKKEIWPNYVAFLEAAQIQPDENCFTKKINHCATHHLPGRRFYQ